MAVPVSESNGAPAMRTDAHATVRCHEHRAVFFPSATKNPRSLATSQVCAVFCVAST